MKKQLSVMVTLQESADLEKVSSELEKAGLFDLHKNSLMGIVSGSIDSEVISANSLRELSGVLAVEECESIELPDPNNPLQ